MPCLRTFYRHCHSVCTDTTVRWVRHSNEIAILEVQIVSISCGQSRRKRTVKDSAPEAAAALDRATPLHEGVLERVLGADALVRVKSQHLFQQVRQMRLQQEPGWD